MNVELVIEGMTWGELRRFVQLGASMPAEDKVGIGYDQGGSFEPNALWVPLEGEPA